MFKHRYGFLPELVERRPNPHVNGENMMDGTDAALLIGDPAMRLAASAERLGLRIYDLAEEWRELTGLPFVFAVWAIRDDTYLDAPRIVRDLQTAKYEGLERLEEIAALYTGQLDLPIQDLRGYLHENVNYDLDDENITGMNRFFHLAHESGLISEVRELRFAPREASISTAIRQ
jgi:chorismate dehydratase